MRYRTHSKTGDKVSEIGFGTAYFYEVGMKEGTRILRRAFENGINYFDLATSDIATFVILREALHDVRKDILLQVHFGADYSRDAYGWTLDLEKVKRSVDVQLRKLQTDYIDYGFIHCQDELSDWDIYKNNGVLDYLLELKKSGVVRHIGLSSHTPEVIQKILDDADVDMLMFSINPAYDYHEGVYAIGSADERSRIYRRCEAENIGITVMKPFSGGQLLNAHSSPFGVALTPYQCMKYALDKPGVLCVLPGIRSVSELDMLLDYENQSEKALDYSVIGDFAPQDASGKCVYCNHCKPCPVGLDIGLINKYYDLAKAGDVLAVEHYKTLEKNAADCIGCGHCDSRCPFKVEQSDRMKEIRAYMESI